MEWQDELELAKQAAIAAGKRLQEVGRSEILDDAGRDVKHRGDMEAESIILETLGKASEYAFLAEESGEHAEISGDSPVWIIDPLDGTLNYSRGIGLSCVSIALWQGNKPILGVVNDFNRGELFSGIVGQGAWCNDQPISVSDVESPQKAVLATGFPVNRDFSSKAIRDFLNQVQQFKKIRLFGSAALSLAYVACGRVDAYSEEDIMFWDVAAGIALVRAAGGYVLVENSGRKRWAKKVRAGKVFSKEYSVGSEE
jgi:myo-inositol-1(or 4)-monophosphatase